MAVTYRREKSSGKTEDQQRQLLYRAGCAIQTCLDDASGSEFIVCARFGSESGEPAEEIIQCSSQPNEKGVTTWLRSLETPPGLKLVDYMYGTREELSQALLWPD